MIQCQPAIVRSCETITCNAQEFVAIAGSEVYRALEKDPEKKRYPGGPFDPLGMPLAKHAGLTVCL